MKDEQSGAAWVLAQLDFARLVLFVLLPMACALAATAWFAGGLGVMQSITLGIMAIIILLLVFQRLGPGRS